MHQQKAFEKSFSLVYTCIKGIKWCKVWFWGSYIEPRTWYDETIVLSYKAFLLVMCQFSDKIDTILVKRYSLNFKMKNAFA